MQWRHDAISTKHLGFMVNKHDQEFISHQLYSIQSGTLETKAVQTRYRSNSQKQKQLLKEVQNTLVRIRGIGISMIPKDRENRRCALTLHLTWHFVQDSIGWVPKGLATVTLMNGTNFSIFRQREANLPDSRYKV